MTWLGRLSLSLSIVLLIATAAVWARSYREVHTLYFGRAHDVLSKLRRRELYVDGDFTYPSDRHAPSRFWFDGDVLVRDSVTPPFFITAELDVPGRLLPAPPPSPTASTQPFTPR